MEIWWYLTISWQQRTWYLDGSGTYFGEGIFEGNNRPWKSTERRKLVQWMWWAAIVSTVRVFISSRAQTAKTGRELERWSFGITSIERERESRYHATSPVVILVRLYLVGCSSFGFRVYSSFVTAAAFWLQFSLIKISVIKMFISILTLVFNK